MTLSDLEWRDVKGPFSDRSFSDMYACTPLTNSGQIRRANQRGIGRVSWINHIPQLTGAGCQSSQFWDPYLCPHRLT